MKETCREVWHKNQQEDDLELLKVNINIDDNIQMEKYTYVNRKIEEEAFKQTCLKINENQPILRLIRPEIAQDLQQEKYIHKPVDETMKMNNMENKFVLYLAQDIWS